MDLIRFCFFRSFKPMKYIIILTIFISCTPPVDYFGNSVDFKKEIIYLTKFREDSSVKDKYYLTFRQVYEIQKDEIKLREKTHSPGRHPNKYSHDKYAEELTKLLKPEKAK